MNQEASRTHIFHHDWEIVVKAFWNKYPCPELDFVKWNKVVDIMMNYDNTMQVQRLVFTQKFKFIWILTLENIKVDVTNKILEMQSQMVIKSKLFPKLSGVERVSYSAYNKYQTIYQKYLEDDSNTFIMKYADHFNNSFKKGIQVIENKCQEFLPRKGGQ